MRNLIESVFWWAKDYWKALALLLALSSAFIAFGIWVTRNANLPPVADEGEVVRFGTYFFEKQPQPVVIVRLSDGSVVQLRVSRGDTIRCRVGSRIRLIRRGEILTVDPRGCPLPAS